MLIGEKIFKKVPLKNQTTCRWHVKFNSTESTFLSKSVLNKV